MRKMTLYMLSKNRTHRFNRVVKDLRAKGWFVFVRNDGRAYARLQEESSTCVRLIDNKPPLISLERASDEETMAIKAMYDLKECVISWSYTDKETE